MDWMLFSDLHFATGAEDTIKQKPDLVRRFTRAFIKGWTYNHQRDAIFGLVLVAYAEEIVFRRCARHVFQIYLP
jgi:hypothetical protein